MNAIGKREKQRKYFVSINELEILPHKFFFMAKPETKEIRKRGENLFIYLML